MKTLYIGCSLTTAPPDFIADIDKLKLALRKDFELLEFVGLDPNASVAAVYETDISCASNADIMLAITDHPSTGLGMELQRRIELEKCTYIAYHAERTITRMVLGAAEKYPFITVLPYRDLSDIIDRVRVLVE